MNRFSIRAASWAPAVIAMCTVSICSHLPGNQIHLPAFPHSDKVIHFSVYLVMGLLLALRGKFYRVLSGRPAGQASLFPGLAAGLLHAVADEFHQKWVPLRDFSWWDILANVLGLTAGLLIIFLVLAKEDKNLPS